MTDTSIDAFMWGYLVVVGLGVACGMMSPKSRVPHVISAAVMGLMGLHFMGYF